MCVVPRVRRGRGRESASREDEKEREREREREREKYRQEGLEREGEFGSELVPQAMGHQTIWA